MADRYYSASELAQLAGVTNRHIAELCKTGRFAGAYKDRWGYWNIPKAEGNKYIKDRKK